MPLPVGKSGTASFLRLLREVLENAAVASTVSRQNSTTAATSSSQSGASASSCSSSSSTSSTSGLTSSSSSTSCARSANVPSGAASSSSLSAAASTSSHQHQPFSRLHTNSPVNSPRGVSAVAATLPNTASAHRPDASHLPMHMLTVASGHAHSHNGFHVSSSGAAASSAIPASRFASLQNDFQRHQIRRKWVFGDDACFIAHHKLADVIGTRIRA